jgi:hypothetical protein
MSQFEGIWFDTDTVTKYINYWFPGKAIFYDIDGSLSGLGPGSWLTPWRQHHNVSECQFSNIHGGAICDSSIQVRRIVFKNYKPSTLTGEGKYINFRTIDDPDNPGEWGEVNFKKSEFPSNAWCLPIVTGHDYEVRWYNGWIEPT